MTPYEERDAQCAEMIRIEIDRVKAQEKASKFHPDSHAWHRAFGMLSGLYLALALIDKDAANVFPLLPREPEVASP